MNPADTALRMHIQRLNRQLRQAHEDKERARRDTHHLRVLVALLVTLLGTFADDLEPDRLPELDALLAHATNVLDLLAEQDAAALVHARRN